MHTSMRLFSLAAVSKSDSRMPFATLYHKARVSHSPWSSTGRTVASSLGPVTSVNTAPVLVSFLVAFHWPSKLLASVEARTRTNWRREIRLECVRFSGEVAFAPVFDC